MSSNPYLNRSMIRSVEEFHGRHREIRRILSRIGAATPQSVSIVGERRMGKSSLLWHLAQPQVHSAAFERPDGCLFILLDFQGQQHLDQSACCALLARRVLDAAGGRVQGGQLTGAGGLEELLAAAEAVDAAGMRLVFLFDEFETVTRNAAIDARFYGALRSLANAHDVAFVTASRRPLQNLCHSQEISESPFFNIFAEVVVGPMPDDEVVELIEAPAATAGIPLAPYTELIRDLGGNLPFFIQIAASAVVECLADGTEVSASRVQAAFVQEASSHFRYFLDAFDDDERALFQALAKGQPVTGELAEQLQAQGFLRRQGDRLVPFSTALLAFCEEQGAAGGDRTAPQQVPASTRRHRIMQVAAMAAVLGVLTAGALWMNTTDSTSGLQIATLSPARVAALGLSVEVQIHSAATGQSPSHHVVTIDENQPEAEALMPLRNGDRLRLALSARAPGLVYVFLISPEGDLQRVPEHAGRPMPVEAGGILLLPSGEDWLHVEPGHGAQPWELIVIAGDSRQGDLEDQLLRQRQATPQQRHALTQSVVAEIRSRGAVAVRFSVAPR